ncbi:hypothetical protein BHM03_00045137 [Ensete ventricosum]|nr:hypothetical protein BHM03_00045137 [Ensete ventricosum]
MIGENLVLAYWMSSASEFWCRSFYTGCCRSCVPDGLTVFMAYHTVVPSTMLVVLAMRRAFAGGGELEIVENIAMAERETGRDTKAVDGRWSLLGTTALVTGGTKGIGHAIVEELARFGAAVHTCARNEAELEKCLQKWEGMKLNVTGSACDVSLPAEREKLMERVASIFHGKLHILVS